MAGAAAMHGAELLRAGFTVAEVVHDYGDVCQAVTDLAVSLDVEIPADGFRTLNRCLDEAIAHAVTEYAIERERSLTARGTERMGFFAHEIANLVTTAGLAFDALQTAKVGISGSTGAVLDRNLARLRHLAERALAEVRLDAGIHACEPVALTELVEQAGAAATLEATARGHQLSITAVEPGVVVSVDANLLSAALANLLQNAFKYSQPHSHIVLSTDTTSPDDRVLIEVEDECGGIPPEVMDGLFHPFERRTASRSGLGLGLAIARDGISACGGTIRVRTLAGQGCVFTVELPRLLVAV
jgi:signal transduction histidine kinase